MAPGAKRTHPRARKPRGGGGHRGIANVVFLVIAGICFSIAIENLTLQSLTETDVAGALGQAFAFSVFQSMAIGLFGLMGLIFLLLAIFYKRR